MSGQSSRRTLTLTQQGWWALEIERRRQRHPQLDPISDWVEVPVWMLDGKRRSLARTGKERRNGLLETG